MLLEKLEEIKDQEELIAREEQELENMKNDFEREFPGTPYEEFITAARKMFA